MARQLDQSVRPELLLLYTIEVVAGSIAVAAFFLWRMTGEASGELSQAVAATVFLSVCFGFALGIAGIGQPAMSPRGDRTMAAIIAATLILPSLAWPLGMIEFPPLEDDSVWWGVLLALLIFTAAALSTRLGIALASRNGQLRRRLALVLGPVGAMMSDRQGGAGETRYGPFEVALAVPGSDALADTLTPQRLRAQRIWAVIAADPVVVPPAVRRSCEDAGVQVLSETDFRERRLCRVELDRLPGDWLATARGTHEGPVEAALRRGLDITASLALLLLTLPLLLLTALAIRIESPGPIFYRQERVGKDGRSFMLFKFRSMRVDAEVGGKPVWASRGDPRVTRVGRFIRLVRIDEIPQVLNVLRGDMAFVGPRPERPGFVEQLAREIPHYNDRACVKPGITGWAQVNYPYGASVEDARQKLAYDLYYVRRRSLALDLLILVATIRVVLFQEGAR